jgi:hypothetical protein
MLRRFMLKFVFTLQKLQLSQSRACVGHLRSEASADFTYKHQMSGNGGAMAVRIIAALLPFKNHSHTLDRISPFLQ